MKYLKDDRGVLPAVVAILVVLLVAVVGFAIYNASKTHQKEALTTSTSPSPSSSPVSTASPTSTQAPGKMLVIKELGVEIPLENGPSDLEYAYVAHPATGVAAATLGTKSSVGSGTCSYSIGQIIKFDGTIPSGAHPYYTTDSSGNTINALLKQFNGFYLQYVPSQNPCTLANGTPYPNKTTSQETINAVNALQLTE